MMRSLALSPAADLSPAIGAVLAHDIHKADGKTLFRKGMLLAEQDLAALKQAREAELHVLVMEPGDIDETTAGQRLALALAGPGVKLADPRQGRMRLTAQVRGLVALDTEALKNINAIDGISIYTRFNGQPIDAGQAIAEAKVVPLVVPATVVEAAEERARQAPAAIISVRPFQPHQVGVVVRAAREGSGERFRESISRRLSWYAASVLALEDVAEDAEAIAALIRQLVERGAGLVIIAGGAFSDPLDPAFLALPFADAHMERNGLPAHPGSMTWLAYVHKIPIVGLASCGWFSESTAADLLLSRLFTGERPRREELADLGVGGLLGPEQAFRFPALR